MSDIQGVINVIIKLNYFRNIDLSKSGWYFVKLSLSSPFEQQCNDVSILTSMTFDNDRHSMLWGKNFITAPFLIKYQNEKIELNQAMMNVISFLIEPKLIYQILEKVEFKLTLLLYYCDEETYADHIKDHIPKYSEFLNKQFKFCCQKIYTCHFNTAMGLHYARDLLFDYKYPSILNLTIHSSFVALHQPSYNIYKKIKQKLYHHKSQKVTHNESKALEKGKKTNFCECEKNNVQKGLNKVYFEFIPPNLNEIFCIDAKDISENKNGKMYVISEQVNLTKPKAILKQLVYTLASAIFGLNTNYSNFKHISMSTKNKSENAVSSEVIQLLSNFNTQLQMMDENGDDFMRYAAYVLGYLSAQSINLWHNFQTFILESNTATNQLLMSQYYLDKLLRFSRKFYKALPECSNHSSLSNSQCSPRRSSDDKPAMTEFYEPLGIYNLDVDATLPTIPDIYESIMDNKYNHDNISSPLENHHCSLTRFNYYEIITREIKGDPSSSHLQLTAKLQKCNFDVDSLLVNSYTQQKPKPFTNGLNTNGSSLNSSFTRSNTFDNGFSLLRTPPPISLRFESSRSNKSFFGACLPMLDCKRNYNKRKGRISQQYASTYAYGNNPIPPPDNQSNGAEQSILLMSYREISNEVGGDRIVTPHRTHSDRDILYPTYKLLSGEAYLSLSSPTNCKIDLANSLSACLSVCFKSPRCPAFNPGLHLVVCIHGLGGHKNDLKGVRSSFRRAIDVLNHFTTVLGDGVGPYLDPNSYEFILTERLSNEDAELGLNALADIVLDQILEAINTHQPSRISFVAHSLGAILVRILIRDPRFASHLSLLHTFISLSGPHLGLLYNSSSVVNAGMWLVQRMRKALTLSQLALKDGGDLNSSSPLKISLRNTFMYRLTQLHHSCEMRGEDGNGDLRCFSNILLVGSRQDKYVPYHSALVQMVAGSEKLKTADNAMTKACVYEEMVKNIMEPLRSSTTNVVRYEINFNLPNPLTFGCRKSCSPSDFNNASFASTLIGRTAHVALIDSEIFLDQFFTLSALKYFI